MLAEAGEWLPDSLLEHLEELEPLWARRLVVWRSADYDLPALARLDERIEANLDALGLAGEEAAPLLRAGLKARSKPAVLSAALGLLRGGDAGAALCVAALSKSKGPARSGLTYALAFAHPPGQVLPLEQIARDGAPAAAAAALYALAFQARPTSAERLVELVSHPASGVRKRAWGAVALLGWQGLHAPGKEALRLALFDRMVKGLSDPLPAVSEAAGVAAAFIRHPSLRPLLRERCGAAPPFGGLLRLLATVGKPEDLPVLVAAAERLQPPGGPVTLRGLEATAPNHLAQRWEQRLRGAYEGTWKGTRAELERA